MLYQNVTYTLSFFFSFFFFIFIYLFKQDGQVEASEERPKKMKSFYIHAVENWDAEFYVKVNDDVYVNIGM